MKPWSDEEIARRAQVTDSDIAIAGNTFRRHADPGFRTMLDATDDNVD